MKRATLASFAVMLTLAACGSEGSRGFEPPAPGDTPPTAPTGDLGTSGGTPKDPVGIGTLTGTVLAPEGTVPISNALVYVADAMPPRLPQAAYCDKCIELPAGTPYTYSKADGTFSMPIYKEGDAFLVVQKGNFRRARKITTKAGTEAIAKGYTTLPGFTNPDVGDEIPRIGIAYGGFDKIELSLVKLGIKSFDRYGKDPILDPKGLPPSVGQPMDLVNSPEKLAQYHIVLLPCALGGLNCGAPSAAQKTNLQNYVKGGGKLYVTDYSYEYVNQTWPGFITWRGKDGKDLTSSAAYGSACQDGAYTKTGKADDPGLGAWLGAIGETSFDLKDSWTIISKVNPMPSTDPEGKPITMTPKVWMTSVGTGPSTVSFESQCGRVLFSTYHAEGGEDTALLAQEKALLYILLEVGVCVGKLPPPR
ncbi:MAG: hypothetical protein JST00_14625 [Deltaproteobacteria bacterium]|nr:hypothetical protein [Deltaproteobacteria bacterium]